MPSGLSFYLQAISHSIEVVSFLVISLVVAHQNLETKTTWKNTQCWMRFIRNSLITEILIELKCLKWINTVYGKHTWTVQCRAYTNILHLKFDLSNLSHFIKSVHLEKQTFFTLHFLTSSSFPFFIRKNWVSSSERMKIKTNKLFVLATTAQSNALSKFQNKTKKANHASIP